MIVYMTHPNHGTHIAYDNGEVERCKKSGWSVREDQPKTPAGSGATSGIVSNIATPINAPVEAPKAKRGRPRKA